MPLYRRGGGPFQRDAVERRSLRWRAPGDKPRTPAGVSVARTSLDLELDRRAQLTRLEAQQSELERLRQLKNKLESVRTMSFTFSYIGSIDKSIGIVQKKWFL